MDLHKVLIDNGLNEKEAKVYLCLLELNEALPSVLARKSGVKRSTTYIILNQLKEKGLVNHHRKNNILYYRTNSPNFFFESQEKKINKLKEALPSLISLNSVFASTPQMSVYEGPQGLIQIMEDTLTTKEELLCWCDIELATTTSLEDYFPSYLKRKIEKNIWLKGIFAYDKFALRHKKEQQKELREVYLIPKEDFPLPNEVNIYDDKVAIISYQDEVGVIIQNEHIAQTQKSMFKLAFEYAKMKEKEILTSDDKEYLKQDFTEERVINHVENCTCPSKRSICLKKNFKV